MKKPDQFMPWHIADYMADTQHLSRDQHGGYMLLLGAYWRHGGPLPDDDARLAMIAKATTAEWRKLRPVLSEFFVVAGGQWSQDRAERELERARKHVANRSEAGSKGAAKRWQTHSQGNGKAMPDHWQNDGPTPSPKQNIEPNGSMSETPLELWQQVWTSGKTYLTASGHSEGHARQALVRWRQQFSEAEILRALKIAQQNAVIEPIPYIEQILKGNPNARLNGRAKPKTTTVQALESLYSDRAIFPAHGEVQRDGRGESDREAVDPVALSA